MKNFMYLLLVAACCMIPVDGVCKSNAGKSSQNNTDKTTALWFTKLTDAQKVAREHKLPILLLMTGSTWCPPCKYLERNVLSTKEFSDFARKNLVLLKVDLPRGNGKLSEDARALLKKYMLWRKEKRAAFNASRIARFGSEPDSGTLSGLYTVGGKRLVLALREKDCKADSTVVPALADGQWRTVFGSGSIDKDGMIKVDKAAWFAVFEEI